LHYVLKKTLLCLSPFAPFVTEALYEVVKGRGGRESIHLESWPGVDENLYDRSLLSKMNIVKEVVTAVLAARQRGGRKLRYPVQRVVIESKSPETYAALTMFERFLKETVNSERLELLRPEEAFADVRLMLEVDLSQAGPRLGRKLPLLLSYLKNVDSGSLVKELEESGGLKITLNGNDFFLEKELFVIKKKVPENFASAENQLATVYVDLTVSPELEALSTAKEVVRRIQVMRKELNLNILDQVKVIVVVEDPEFRGHVEAKKKYIEEETRSTLTINGQIPEDAYVRDWDVEGVLVKICVAR